MTSTNDRQDSTSVWYFIAATFVLTLPNLLFPDVHPAAKVALFLAGIAVMALGFVRLRRELAARNPPPREDDSSPN